MRYAEGTLDKGATSHDDCFDAFRPSIQGFFEQQQQQTEEEQPSEELDSEEENSDN